MTVSTLLAILLALVLVLTLDATAALAKHYNCFWKAHEGSPGAFNYTLFCRGQMVRDNSDANLADWVCAAGNVGSLGTKIADWSRLRKNILELGTPCGTHGYGSNDGGGCLGRMWAMCRGPSAQGDCAYMKEKDDCEWPGEQQSDVLPQEINIWYHEGPGYELDEWVGERSS